MDIYINLRPWKKREPDVTHIEKVQGSVKLRNHELSLSRSWLSLEKIEPEDENSTDNSTNP